MIGTVLSKTLIKAFRRGPFQISFFLSCYGKQDFYWIGFVSHFGLYRRQTSEQGTKPDNSPHNDDVKEVSVLLESELIGPVKAVKEDR